MTSFLSRIANEATAALSDAYGHVMHGDDAGSSARLVWVVHPTRVSIDTDKINGVRESRYTQKFDLGLTFLEINDRAYVRSVTSTSHAAASGIQPEDCVQFACVVGGPQFESELEAIYIRQSMLEREDGEMNSPGSVGSQPTNTRRRNNNSRLERDELEEEKRRLDEKACQFAVECEKRGMRSSYEELRNLFLGCTLPPQESVETSNDDHRNVNISTPQRKQTNAAFLTPTRKSKNLDELIIDDTNSLLMSDSVGGTFQAGKSNKYNLSSRCVPALSGNKTAKVVKQNVTNAARNASACFMDNSDEGEGDSSFTGNRLNRSKQDSFLLDTPASPVKNEGVPSPRRQRGDVATDGLVYTEEQQLYPVVIVFRRTVQRKQLTSPRKGMWGSPGLSIRGSLFGIPSFRMDDECDRAAALVRQLAPTRSNKNRGADGLLYGDDGENSTIHDPSVATALDHRSGFTAKNDNIEASTIRGMIQNAVGLGFVRTSKVVVGVSLQAGSGIVIARLPDGTWSAPSAIGVYGLGVGMQFGLEVADYIFILQTKESVEHFQRGGNFALGGNIGISVATCGREAYGAASLGACTGSRTLEDQIQQGDSDDEGNNVVFDEATTESPSVMNKIQQKKSKGKNAGDIAPMVAYAKSQGLYFGFSVDGLKFFTRNDINSRTYKFSTLSEIAAKDILGGVVSPPPAAEELYAALHSVEYVHDVDKLPYPPKLLRKDAMNDWRYDRSTIARKGEILEINGRTSGYPLYNFLSALTTEEATEFAIFETKFKKFMYGGVTVQRLLPNSPPSRSGMTRREKRTLWLMLPEVGSLRLGFVSKLNDEAKNAVIDDMSMVSSIAPSRTDDDDQTYSAKTGNIRLSDKQSMSITDITALSQDPNVSVRLSPDDATEHLRIISIDDVTGKSLLFIAGSNHEAELLVCGLKLLLECESARLGVRGGVALNKLGGKLNKDAISPTSARGAPKLSRSKNDKNGNRKMNALAKADLDDRSKYSSIGEPGSSSDSDDNEKSPNFSQQDESLNIGDNNSIPEKRTSWSQVPSRSYMRGAAEISPSRQLKTLTYELGKEICNEVATNISLPIPLATFRMLFLDSTSPVINTWEGWRGDRDFRRSDWTFAPGSSREFEKKTPEQQLISSGSMAGAQRTISYGRVRNQEVIRLSETIIVDSDDSQKLVFTITDRMPRRGFSAKARITVRALDPQSCEAQVVSEISPVGKNLSDQQAVHRAFVLVLEEMKMKYGIEGKGLLAIFLEVNIPKSKPTTAGAPSRTPQRNLSSSIVSPSRTSGTRGLSMTTLKDALPNDNGTFNANPFKHFLRDSKPSAERIASNSSSNKFESDPRIISSPKHSLALSSFQKTVVPQVDEHSRHRTELPPVDEFSDFSNFPKNPNPVTVEVKPLPKIRLDLCPVPREEDEEEDSVSLSATKLKKKSRPSRSKHKSRRKTSQK